MNPAFSARFTSRLGPVLHALGKALPWLSMAWGVASGLLISRRFEMASRVLVFAIALLVASLVFGLWSSWRERQDQSAEAGQGLEGEAHRGRLFKHQGRIDWALVTGTQVFSQYLLMFSLTFLYWTGAWLYLGLALLAVCTTLWDPLFFRVVRLYPYRLLLRAAAFALAASFLVGALFPKFISQYAMVSLAAAFLGAFPGRVLHGRVRGLQAYAGALLPLACVGLAALAHSMWGGLFRFPVLSVWVKGGEFALQDAQGEWLPKPTGFASEALSLSDVASTLAEGGRLCCVSPVVAPRALQSEVVHEWWQAGQKVDTILLPELKGRDEGAAYRTFSCKKNLPARFGDDDLRVECRVFVGRMPNERVEVGALLLSFVTGRAPEGVSSELR
jgi:hypothetical protein